MRRRALALGLSTVALILPGCGGDEEEPASETSASSTTGTEASEEEVATENDVFVGGIEAGLTDQGVAVFSIEVGSPIDVAGLQADDIIVSLDGQAVETNEDLAEAIAGLSATYDGGDEVELVVKRAGTEKTLTIALVANVYLGAELKDAPKSGGAEAVSVPKKGPADLAGMEPGDVIVAIDGQPVSEVSDVFDALSTHAAGDEIEIEVSRGGSRRSSPPRSPSAASAGQSTPESGSLAGLQRRRRDAPARARARGPRRSS